MPTQSADAQTFIPSGSALVRSEHDRSCISHDPVAEDMRSGASRTSQLHQGPSPEILTAGSIHLIVNDMVRRAAILDGHSHETMQFILDNIQRFWAFRLEDELDAIRSSGCCTSRHSYESSSTASSASTEASFHTAVSSPVDSDLDLLGSDKSGNGETASRGTHACDANDAAWPPDRDHTEDIPEKFR